MTKGKTCGHCARSYNGYCRQHSKEVGFFDTSCDDYAEPLGSPTASNAPNTNSTKVCKTCGRELPLSAFGGHHRTVDHLQASCKECMTKKIKEGTRPAWGKAPQPKAKKKAPPKTELDEILDKAEPRPIQEPEVKYEPTCKCNLDDYTPQELYDELKRRGWSGTQTKVETLN